MVSAPARYSAHAPDGGRDLLRSVAAGTAGATGEAFFRSLTRHLAEAFGAEFAFVAELTGDPPRRGRVLATSHLAEDLREGSEYDIAGTPCELITRDDMVSIPEGVCERFPADEFSVRHGLDGYLAVAMRDSGGEQLGYIGVQSTRRLDPKADERAAMAIFSARAAAEIERRRHEAVLRAHEAELAASRVRIVEAADEERRRIGRNLHDGAQQRLVSLGHMLSLAERRLNEDPAGASALLEQAREQAALAGDELRELVRGLHPAGLAEHGLGHALATLATRSPLPLRIDAMPERRLPPAVEATVYYLVSEAITNAIKHAEASGLPVSPIASPRSAARCASTARRARGRAWRRRSRSRRGAARASRSWSSGTPTTAGSARSCCRWCSTAARPCRWRSPASGTWRAARRARASASPCSTRPAQSARWSRSSA